MSTPVRRMKAPEDGRITTAFPDLVVHEDEAPIRWRARDHSSTDAILSHRCTDPKYGDVLVDSSDAPTTEYRVFRIADVVLLEEDNWPVGMPRPDAPATPVRRCKACETPAPNDDARFCASCGKKLPLPTAEE